MSHLSTGTPRIQEQSVDSQVVACNNCKRWGVDVSLFDFATIKNHNCKKKKFYYIETDNDDSENVQLCRCCAQYLMTRSSTAPKYKYYWPSMIFGFLFDDSYLEEVVQMTFIEKWRLIPVQWRHWWASHFQQELSLHREEECRSLFHDVTKELVALNEAIAELKWVNLPKAMDRHMAYPEVCNINCQQILFLLLHQ